MMVSFLMVMGDAFYPTYLFHRLHKTEAVPLLSHLRTPSPSLRGSHIQGERRVVTALEWQRNQIGEAVVYLLIPSFEFILSLLLYHRYILLIWSTPMSRTYFTLYALPNGISQGHLRKCHIFPLFSSPCFIT